MSLMSNKLSTWLAKELNKRSWSARELGRRIGLSHTTINRYVEGTSIPSTQTCQKLATVLNADGIEIMRLAGHIPPALPAVKEENEALGILRRLPSATRTIIMQMLRSLNSARPIRALAETSTITQYTTANLDDRIAVLIDAHPPLSTFFANAQAQLPTHAILALVVNVEVWMQQTSRDSFTDLHNKLSGLLSSM